MFMEIGADLPKMTLLLVAVSKFMMSYYSLIVLSAVVALTIAYWQLLKQPEERLRIDRLRLKVPVYGAFVLKNEVARFARTLGTLLGNGVPILRALDITKTMIKNQAIAAVMADIAENVKEGARLSTRLMKSEVFPPVAVHMVAVGEETGSLDTTLLRVATTYEKETERQLKTLTTLVEPVMILVMGAIVGFIVMAMILPIFQLSAAIQ
jgi:type II secretory pathway component PulF